MHILSNYAQGFTSKRSLKFSNLLAFFIFPQPIKVYRCVALTPPDILQVGEFSLPPRHFPFQPAYDLVALADDGSVSLSRNNLDIASVEHVVLSLLLLLLGIRR